MSLATASMNSFDICCDGRAGPGHHCDPFEMVRVFGGRVFAIAKHITQNEDEAGDVLIEAFLEVCPDEMDGGRECGSVWLRLVSVAVREAFSKLCARGEDRLNAEELDPCEELLLRELLVWGDDYHPRDSAGGTSRMLEHGLRSLDPMCRTVFVLKDIEGIPVKHIAPIVDRSEAAVEVCLLRARLRLGELLKQQTRQ